MRDPTFVIGGGQRCGTTWLYHLLDKHPQIYLAKPVHPEPKFFISESSPGRDMDWYLNTWFSDVQDELAVGEKSTAYLDNAEAAQRMKHLLPDLKVLFILRHPVDRAISNYRFSKQNGLESESLQYALDHEQQRLKQPIPDGVSSHPQAYLTRSHYARYIERYLGCFDRSQVMVVIKECLQDEPKVTLDTVCRFLGVDPFQPEGIGQVHNITAQDSLALSRSLASDLLGTFEPSNRLLERLVGCNVRHWDELSPMMRLISR